MARVSLIHRFGHQLTAEGIADVLEDVARTYRSKSPGSATVHLERRDGPDGPVALERLRTSAENRDFVRYELPGLEAIAVVGDRDVGFIADMKYAGARAVIARYGERYLLSRGVSKVRAA